ncbi:hypothetical protein B0T21DRAFT_160273 [Apiosordaria backusii]|uniref:Secreted protein n=1 Tax=Apiosordaria backusii TaxID=314023 RepID=A0AA40BN48_9PEZI|nr:hypothetical protein B0T21DRAFT_160273 [Apiosordaria backusii]
MRRIPVFFFLAFSQPPALPLAPEPCHHRSPRSLSQPPVTHALCQHFHGWPGMALLTALLEDSVKGTSAVGKPNRDGGILVNQFSDRRGRSWGRRCFPPSEVSDSAPNPSLPCCELVFASKMAKENKSSGCACPFANHRQHSEPIVKPFRKPRTRTRLAQRANHGVFRSRAGCSSVMHSVLVGLAHACSTGTSALW